MKIISNVKVPKYPVLSDLKPGDLFAATSSSLDDIYMLLDTHDCDIDKEYRDSLKNNSCVPVVRVGSGVIICMHKSERVVKATTVTVD